MTDEKEPRPELDDAPPLLGSWRNIYLTVVGALAFYVVAMWAFSKVYS